MERGLLNPISTSKVVIAGGEPRSNMTVQRNRFKSSREYWEQKQQNVFFDFSLAVRGVKIIIVSRHNNWVPNSLIFAIIWEFQVNKNIRTNDNASSGVLWDS